MGPYLPPVFLPPASSYLAIPGCPPLPCSQILYTLAPHLSASSSLCSLPAPSLWRWACHCPPPFSPQVPLSLVSPFPLLSVSPLSATTSQPSPLSWAPASHGALSDLQGGWGGGGGVPGGHQLKTGGNQQRPAHLLPRHQQDLCDFLDTVVCKREGPEGGEFLCRGRVWMDCWSFQKLFFVQCPHPMPGPTPPPPTPPHRVLPRSQSWGRGSQTQPLLCHGAAPGSLWPST